MGIGTNLKGLLKEKKMTMQELSKVSGVSTNTLYGIVKRDNNTVQPDILEKISKALNISEATILGLEGLQKKLDDLKLKGVEIEKTLDELEESFTDLIYKLNADGITEAYKRIAELTQLEQYKRKE